MVGLFHVYRQRADTDRARAVANAIWAEADSVRRGLEFAGDRLLSQDARLPIPPVRL